MLIFAWAADSFPSWNKIKTKSLALFNIFADIVNFSSLVTFLFSNKERALQKIWLLA